NEQIRLIQKKQGLTFGTDAFLLAAYVRPQRHATAVDLGSGTGIIPLLLCAKEKVKEITAVELQPSFADLIRRNAALNGMEDRIHICNEDVRTLSVSSFGHEVELVCSNPPYLKTNAGKSNRAKEKEIARHEVYGGISDFCATASRLLKTKGRFACVFRTERLSELFAAMRENRLEPKRMVMVHPDVSAPPCMVLLEAVKDAAPALCVEPPLILYTPREATDVSRRMTAQAAEIYRTCSFPTRESRNNEKEKNR
ncbi:MAG: methyltransferase, partial [Clostridia bacterium]|nr:methyltransferase [Clostridia bacterium]